MVRHVALTELAAGWPDDPATGSVLVRHATDDEDDSVRAAAVTALGAGWRHDPRTGSVLRDRAERDLEDTVRLAAVQALAPRPAATAPAGPADEDAGS
jgi:hypothetical protein